MIRRPKQLNLAKVKIIGVGGGGSNAVTRMAVGKAKNLDLACINTDAQALDLMQVPNRLCIGPSTTNGLGSGGDPSMGWKAAEESKEEIEEMIGDADMVFVAAGMGGGTGTGAAPIVAELARELGALTVGVVTKPFSFEGRARMSVAEEGINMLVEHVDTLITIDNNRLLDACEYDLPMSEAFGIGGRRPGPGRAGDIGHNQRSGRDQRGLRRCSQRDAGRRPCTHGDRGGGGGG